MAIDTETVKQIVEDVKALLAIPDDTKDALLSYHAKGVIQKILNYCHLETLPEGLLTVATEMTIRAYNAWTATGQYGYENVEGIVSSISRGDFSVTFDTNGQAVSDVKRLDNRDILLDYRAQLNAYRKVKTL